MIRRITMKSSAEYSLFDLAKHMSEDLAAINYDCSVARTFSTTTTDIVITIKNKIGTVDIKMTLGHNNGKYFVKVADESEEGYQDIYDFECVLDELHLYITRYISGYDVIVAKDKNGKCYAEYRTKNICKLYSLLAIAVANTDDYIKTHNYNVDTERLQHKVFVLTAINVIGCIALVAYILKKRKNK